MKLKNSSIKSHSADIRSSVIQATARTTAHAKPQVRCAIYARKSTEEGLDSEFNSVDAQREYCTKYVELEGWSVSKIYEDGGFTGSNTERPGLQQLLLDVQAGLVDVVIVHRLDRLSRSLLDFLKIYAILETHNVDFVSVTEKFDTRTAAGKCMMRMMAVFAEFGRESCIQHLLAKIASAKQKGMWLGGTVPFGYRAVDKKLVIDEAEAEIVRLILAEFIRTRSIKKVVSLLRAKGIKTRKLVWKNRTVGGHYFGHSMILHKINNPIYIGKLSHKGVIYQGQQEAIISDEVWDAAQSILQVNAKKRSGIAKQKVAFMLNGLLECGGCGRCMGPTHTKKASKKEGEPDRIYRYYHTDAHKKGNVVGCTVQQVPASEIEAVVLAQLQRVFKEPEVIVAAWKNANCENSNAISEEQIRELLSGIEAVCQELFPIEQEQLLHTMLEKVVLREDSIELVIKVDGLVHLAQMARRSETRSEEARGSDAGSSSANQLAAVPVAIPTVTPIASNPNVISVKVPFQTKRGASTRKVLILPEGIAKPKYKPDEALVKALVKAHMWQKRLDDGKFANVQAMAKRYGVNPSAVHNVLRLNWLAPQIKRAILDGTQPREMNMEMLKVGWPDEWQEQARWFRFSRGSDLDNYKHAEPCIASAA